MNTNHRRTPQNRFRPTSVFIIGLTLLALALRVHNLGTPSLWYDEVLELDIAQGPLDQIWPQLDRHSAMPLDYYLLHGWITLGRQETWVRFPALWFGILAVPLIFRLGSRLFNRRTGVIAALLLTCSSFAVEYSQEARPYSLLLLLVLVGYLGLWQAYRTGQRRYWVLVTFGIVGATLTHYFALFMLLPMGLWVAVQQIDRLKRPKFWLHTACFALCVLILLLVLILIGRFWRVYGVGDYFASVVARPETLTLPASEKPNRGPGPPVERAFFANKVLAPLSTGDEPAVLLFNGLYLIPLLSVLRPRSKNRSAGLLLLSWLLLPILLIYLFLLHRGTFYAIRYILYTLPAYLILVAHGIDALLQAASRTLRPRTSARRILTGVAGPVLSPLGSVEGRTESAQSRHHFSYPRQPAGLPGLAVTGLLILVLLPLTAAEFDELRAHYGADSREDWRAVGRLLADNARPGDVVIAIKAEPAINWYYPPASAPFGTYSRNQPLWQAMDEHPRRWFVLSSYSQYLDKGLRHWLDRHQAVVIEIDRRIVVYLQDDELSSRELLSQVRSFVLPQKAQTYATLADQFKRHRDFQTSRAFYQKAIELAGPEHKEIVKAKVD